MRKKYKISQGIVLMSFLLLFTNMAISQDEGFSDEIRKLLNDGLEAYEKGKYDVAREKIEIALNKKPDSELIRAFCERVSWAKIFEMFNAPDEELRNTADHIIALAKPGGGGGDISKINEYIEALKSEDISKQLLARFHLKNIGPYAVKHLLPALGDEREPTFRVRVILTLEDMSKDATNALIEALDSKNDLLRKNAAIILGNLRDERAIAAIKKVYENPNEKLDVKKEANEALQKITGQPVSELRPSKEYYYELAEKYYYSLPSVMPIFQHTYLIWKWDKEKDELTERETPSFAYSNQLAEEACFDALELDPNYEKAWTLLVSIYISQYLQGEQALKIAEKKVELKQMETQVIDQLKKKLGDIKQFSILSSMIGKKYIYRALEKAIEDGKTDIARVAIELLKGLAKYNELPPLPKEITNENMIAKTGEIKVPEVNKKIFFGYPLINALISDDKMLRYAASDTLIHLNPLDKRLGASLVIPTITSALSERSVYVALIIYDRSLKEDIIFLNKLCRTLKSLNIFPVVTTSGNEGIMKARAYPSFDVIFLRSKIANQVFFVQETRKEPVVETVLEALKTDVRTKNIPIYLISKDKRSLSSNMEIYRDKIDTYMTTSAEKIDLKNWLDQTFQKEEVQKSSKEHADKIARMAAEAIEEITPTNTLFPYRDTIDTLIKTLDPAVLRDDSIRLPCIRALGKFGDARAINILAQLLNDPKINKKTIRLASAKSLSQIFKQTELAPSNDILDILRNNLQDTDYEISTAVSEIIGNAKLTNKQVLELQKLKRLKHTGE